MPETFPICAFSYGPIGRPTTSNLAIYAQLSWTPQEGTSVSGQRYNAEEMGKDHGMYLITVPLASRTCENKCEITR